MLYQMVMVLDNHWCKKVANNNNKMYARRTRSFFQRKNPIQ